MKKAILATLFVLASVTLGNAQTTYFSFNGEDGQIDPWTAPGSKVTNSNAQAQSGSRSLRHEVDGWEHAGKVILFTRNASTMLVRLTATEAYYSTWYYLDHGWEDAVWKNAMQWKSDNGSCASPPCIPGDVKMLMGPIVVNGARQWEVQISDCQLSYGSFPKYQWKSDNPCKFRQISNPMSTPKYTWHHIEVYYKATSTNGHIIVWQNGVEIFNVSHPQFNTLTNFNEDPNYPNQWSNNRYLYWGVGAYIGGASQPSLHILYTDDAMVTDYQVYPTLSNKPTLMTPSPPSDLRVTVQ